MSCARWIAASIILLLTDTALAVTYTFNTSGNPVVSGSPSICSGTWSRSGSTFTCSGNVSTAAGDVLAVSSNTNITVAASGSLSLASTTVGTAARNISLQTSSGTLTATGTNTIRGSVTAGSGAINLAGSTISGSVRGTGTATLSGSSVAGDVDVDGNITLSSTAVTGAVIGNFGAIGMTGGSVTGNVSSGGGITSNGTTLGGSVSSTSGTINLTGGSVAGLVRSNCCNVTTSGTDLESGARADSGSLSITGGTVAGNFYAGNNSAAFSGVNMTSGTVSGASTVTFTDSSVGGFNSSVTITSVSGAVTLNNSTVYGDLTAPSYSTIMVNSPSKVYGTCLPNSTPANACTPIPACFTDNFNRSSLGTEWITTKSSGSFDLATVGNRMRITNATGNVATAATLQRLFPAAGNVVQVQFKHYAYGGSGADGVGVIFSDAGITPQTGAFGGPLGYGTKGAGNDGFAGGWLGVGIDEYGNFSNEGGPGSVGQRPDSVAIRGSGSGTNGYRYIAGTPANLNPGIDISGSTAGPGYTYRITVDNRTAGQARVTVERDTGSGFVAFSQINGVNVLAASGQAPLPQEFYLSLTGSTGGSTNIHELDDVQVCALQMNPIGQQIDHFEFVTSSGANTCSPQTVTVTACSNAAPAACQPYVAGPVTVNLSSSGWIGGSTKTLVNGVGTFQLQGLATTMPLGITDSTPKVKPFTQTLCKIGTGALSSACSLTFAQSGFIFDVPNKLANKPATNIGISAVVDRGVIGSPKCEPAFVNVDRNVNFWSDFIDPTAANLTDATQRVSVNDQAVGQDVATSTAILLRFDNAGKSALKVNYPEAGQMQLNARYAGSATAGDSGLMIGSDQFVSSPAGFCIEALTPVTGTPTGVAPTCSDSRCAAYQRAGRNFPLRLRAKAWDSDSESDTALCDNLDTRNFRHAALPLTAATLDGGVNGSLGIGSASFASSADVNLSQSISEVGRFQFTLGNAASYLTVPLTSSKSAAVGRFVPDSYEVTVQTYEAACEINGNASTYAGLAQAPAKVGQPFKLAAGVRARNAQGATTANYDKSLGIAGARYARLEGKSATVEDYINPPPGTPESANDGAPLVNNTLSFTNGVSAVTLSQHPTYVFNAPRPPYSVSLVLSVTDDDGITGSSNYTAAKDFRLGQARIGNAHGSELQGLALPFVAGYFDGSGYVPNLLDSCTTFDGVALGTYGGNLTAGETVLSFRNSQGLQIPPYVVSAGSSAAGGYWLSAPGAGNDGSVLLTYATPDWLKFDWDGDGTVDNASGLATFGIYKGPERLIFRRELYR